MDYDRARVRDRIQYIEASLERLETLRRLSKDEFLADFRNIESAKHLLQTAIEAMMDIASHILARRRLPTPHEGGETFRRLGEAGLLPPERVQVYVQMVKFRNLIVHLYQEVDVERVYQVLQDGLDDLRQFIAEVWGIVGRGKSSGPK